MPRDADSCKLAGFSRDRKKIYASQSGWVVGIERYDVIGALAGPSQQFWAWLKPMPPSW